VNNEHTTFVWHDTFVVNKNIFDALCRVGCLYKYQEKVVCF